MQGADRDAVVRALREMAVLLRVRGESEYRVRAYETGARRIEQFQGSLPDLVARGKLTEIPGIGEALAARISELVTTGRSAFLDELKASFPPGIGELIRVPSLGVKKVMELWKELGIGDVDALEQACRDGKIRGLKGFGAKTEAKILEAIEQLKAEPPPSDKKLLGHALPLSERLLEELRRMSKVSRAELAGDTRRGTEEIERSELVVAAAAAPALMDELAKLPIVAGVNNREDTRCTVSLFERELALDIQVVQEPSFATALLHATGSAAHVERLRALAEQRGLRLTAEGLFKSDKPLPMPDEESIYEALGLPWIPPELRENGEEIDRALQGSLPGDLVTVDDILGAVHSHSTWSDGTNTLEEMALDAQARGLRYLTVTEHSQTASYAGGIKPDDLKRLYDQVDELNEKLETLKLLKGIESDILPDGSLDYPDETLEKMDVVIGSVHARHQMDENAMTTRILKAFDNPHLHIWGHATGRLLQRRPPYAIRMEEVLDKAAAKGIAVEINGSPHRLDLKAEHVRAALDRGVKLVASVDAHSTRELGYVTFAVATARRGWARKKDVLNTLGADEFLKALRARP